MCGKCAVEDPKCENRNGSNCLYALFKWRLM